MHYDLSLSLSGQDQYSMGITEPGGRGKYASDGVAMMTCDIAARRSGHPCLQSLRIL
jgi:hypothetical protein